jgi:hypothetical protein
MEKRSNTDLLLSLKENCIMKPRVWSLSSADMVSPFAKQVCWLVTEFKGDCTTDHRILSDLATLIAQTT